MATDTQGKSHSVRISDQAGNSEEFSAHDRIAFCAGLLDALARYVDSRAATIPLWQGRRRQAIRAAPPSLQLDYLDPRGSELNGHPVWMPCSLPNQASPQVSAQAAFGDGAAHLWACVESTASRAEEMARFFGYHEDGENRLRDFFNACLTEEPDTNPQPRLNIVGNHRKNPPPKT